MLDNKKVANVIRVLNNIKVVATVIPMYNKTNNKTNVQLRTMYKIDIHTAYYMEVGKGDLSIESPSIQL